MDLTPNLLYWATAKNGQRKYICLCHCGCFLQMGKTIWIRNNKAVATAKVLLKEIFTNKIMHNIRIMLGI